VSFIRTGLREIGLKVRRQRTRMALRHEKRHLQKSEINLGREGTSQAANFPELRNEIVALRKLEQEQKEVALRIAQIEEGIKTIEQDRQRNLREQSEALAKLEAEKKPILQRRDDAKRATEVCDRELMAVEGRMQNNDAADQELLKQVSELQALVPPPSDLEAKLAAIGTRRSRLPEERAELVRARMGSAEACRLAREKLIAGEAELSAIQKNIDRVRGEYEGRDKSFAEDIKTQQEAVKEARAQIQTVEERKNPAYLNIGRHLAAQGIAPPNAPHLLTHVQRHRTAVDRHVQHTQELTLLSSKIDKQELRKFYFSIVSVLFLLSIILPLVLKSPRRREWLPQETEAILFVNLDQLARDDLPKRWQKEQPDIWANVWSGLIAGAARAPALNMSRDVARITRAITNSKDGRIREFILLQTHGDVTSTIRSIAQDKTFERRTIAGLAVWERPDLAVARVGPTTLAIGNSSEVDELVQVRLGMQTDLKLSGQLSDRFETADRESAVRVLSRDPTDLSRIFHPILTREMLDASQLIGLTLTLQNPAHANLFIKAQTAEGAAQLARALHDEPQRWLRLPDSDLLLFTQPPAITRKEADLEIHFTVPENSARLLLQRLAKTDTPPIVAAQPTGAQ
jgi:hypothetical protein